MHTLIHSFTPVMGIVNSPTGMFLEVGRKMKNPEESHANTWRTSKLDMDSNLSTGSNHRTCEFFTRLFFYYCCLTVKV